MRTNRRGTMVLARLQMDGFTPKSRVLPKGTLLAVPCPDCGAEVKARCVYPDGAPRHNVHPYRKRMAMRKYNAERAEQAG